MRPNGENNFSLADLIVKMRGNETYYKVLSLEWQTIQPYLLLYPFNKPVINTLIRSARHAFGPNHVRSARAAVSDLHAGIPPSGPTRGTWGRFL